MEMPDYPSNNKDEKEVPEKKERQTKVAKVVDGEVSINNPTIQSKMAESFGRMWQYVAQDVLIPAAKDMVSDAVAQATDSLLFGESRGGAARRKTHNSSGKNGYVSYNRYSASQHVNARDEPGVVTNYSKRARATHDFGEILVKTRLEGEAVVDQLFEIVSKYDVATVADLYDLVGLSPTFTDEKWGWTDLRGSNVRRVRKGFSIELPSPEYID